MPLLHLGQHADRADQMLIDGKVMVHIELHHRDDTAKWRNEPLQHTRLIHAPQACLWIDAPRQQFEKDSVGFGIGPQLRIYQAK